MPLPSLMRGRSTSQKMSLSEPCMTAPNEVWVAALHRTILGSGATSLCEVAHASNHGTDGSGPVRRERSWPMPRAADFIPPFAGLHEFRAQRLSWAPILQRMIALYENYN